MQINTLTATLDIPGYEIGSVILRLGGRVVYRARRLIDGAAVAIETLDAEYPDRAQVARIRREGTIAKKLSPVEGVRRVYTMLPHGSGNLALIGELFEESIKSQLEQSVGHGLPLVKVLDISLRLTQALGGIHSQNIVHKALSPEHVLLNPLTGHIALSGFGIASELDQERQAMQFSRQLEGPLPYMSPEQTGRMNRDLDYRSDYYSLGVLMFEMLTGQQPFQSDDLLEWVHGHISRMPSAPHEIMPLVPEALSLIVLKLISKCPEARYQSAEGLSHDLERCIDALSSKGKIETFALAEQEVVHKFLIPQKLYGRDDELLELFRLFELAASGRTEFCLVHGYSGVGKSALVNELDRPLVRERGFLVQGKFEQFQHGEAYTALATAFRSLVHQVLAESEERLSDWRENLLEALEPNGQLVIDLVPELRFIIGEQPAVAELPPAEERNRLQIVLTAFLRVFAAEGHPLVMFLDDLQWSDVPTLELLRRLMTARELSHLLLIGAYRSNEVGAGHPLRSLLEDLHSQKNISEIPIGPLNKDSIAHLTSDALYREPDEVSSLTDMLYEKAQGNPFFTNELLRQLHKEGAIFSDSMGGRWNWSLDDVLWSSVSNDVVEFMVGNLRALEPETQKVLQLAACIGGTFELKTLATIYEHSVDETAVALLPALKQYLIIPMHTDYRLLGENIEILPFELSYKFQHDRVQQAAYALIRKRQLPVMHLLVGRLMLRHVGYSVPEDRLIDIVGHFNLGKKLIKSSDERLRLAKLNLRAGVRAKHSAAYEAALNYLKIVEELLPSDPWADVPLLVKTLAAEIQQCSYLTGRIDDAESWIEIMLEHAESDLERASILAIRTRQYATLGRMEDSILSAIEGLAILGVEFSPNPSIVDIAEERRLVEENLGSRRVEELVDAPPVTDEATLTAIRLLMEIFAAAFLSGSGNLFPYQVLKAVNLVLRHGNCPEAAFSYAAYGMLLCGEFDEPALGYEYGKAGLAINEYFDDITLRARVIYVYAMFVHHWNNDWASLTSWFRKGIEAGYQSGDLLYLAYSAQDCVIWDPTLDLETAEQLHSENLEIVRECAYQDSLDSGTLFLQLQRNLLGHTQAPNSLSSDDFDESQCLTGMRQRQFMTGIANHHIYNAEIGLLYGDYDQALEHVQEQDKLIKSAMSLPQLVRFYIVAFLTLVVHYPKMAAHVQGTTRRRLEHDLARMTGWADNCEVNFRHLQYLMEAELIRLGGDNHTALERYDLAIETAQKSGFLRDEATACERAARHLLAQGERRSAEGYLRGAYRLYDRWGAYRKVIQLEQEFPVLHEFVANTRVTAQSNDIDALDMASIMKASREISGEIVLDRLLKTTMKIVLENTGAQWGCLAVLRDGKLQAGATILPDEGLSTDGVPEQLLIPSDDLGQLPVPVALISHVLHSGEAMVLHNASSEGLFVTDPYVLNFQPVSVICVPLKRERFEAALYMENNLVSDVFTEERVEIVKLLTAQASVAIENARLYEQVQEHSRTLQDKVAERTARLQQLNYELQRQVDRDGLTGVANRRCGDAYLEQMWSSLQQDKQPLSLVMLDVDHFKAFNDNYGHQLGDDCLITVAKTVQEQLLRTTDLVARFGGEEFMIIMPYTNDSDAIKLAEEVRLAVESKAIDHDHSSAGVVTVSAGVATIIPGGEEGLEQLVRAADVALYSAKRMGRNKVYSQYGETPTSSELSAG